MELQIPFQYVLLICGFLGLFSELFKSYQMKEYSSEKLIHSYLAGLTVAAGIGTLNRMWIECGLRSPVITSMEDLKVYLPCMGIVLLYFGFERLFPTNKKKEEA